MADSTNLVVVQAEVIAQSGVDSLLATIRPHWRAKNLIERVRRLLSADPSSACQRIFNASIHDLKEKLCVAGFDIVGEAARLNKLPGVSSAEDVERYTAYNTIDLSYRVGLLNRPESRRLFRAYEIRGDLEHEDDQYEATPEDCIYVFKTCIDYVLARDPIEVIRLLDVKNIVEQPAPALLTEGVMEDFQRAPEVRQLEIIRFLVSNAVNKSVPDVVRQNCYSALSALRDVTRKQVLITTSQDFVQRIGRGAPDLLHARVAYGAGIFPYLKRAQIAEFFRGVLGEMKHAGYSFRSHTHHGEMLRNLKEVGGLTFCPDDLKPDLLEWLVLCYIGEPGGYGAGWNRGAFYSNVGAPLAYDLIKESAIALKPAFEKVKSSSDVRAAITYSHVARRFEKINDIFSV